MQLLFIIILHIQSFWQLRFIWSSINVPTSLSVREEVNTSHSRERPAPAVTTVAQREEPVVPLRQEKGTCDRNEGVELDHSGGGPYPLQHTHNPTTACRVTCSSQQHNTQ